MGKIIVYNYDFLVLYIHHINLYTHTEINFDNTPPSLVQFKRQYIYIC